MNRIGLLVFILGIFIRPGALAGDLLELKSGKPRAFSALLALNNIVVVVEEDCVACKAYLKELKRCSAVLQQKIQIVSVSSALKTKRMLQKESIPFPVYLAKQPFSAKIKGTPSTFLGGDVYLGKLDCTKAGKLSGFEP